MKRVLVPYDGSDCSMRALEFAIRLPEGASPPEVHLINIQAWPAFYGELMTAHDLQADRSERLMQGRRLMEPAARTLAARKIPFRTHVMLGGVEEAIAHQATELCCEQIVMGSRGLGSLEGVVVGSVANKVVHLASVPVTLVK